MNQTLNQFAQGDIVGRLDLHGNPNTFSAIVDNSYSGTGLLPGQAVKVVPSPVGTVHVVPVESATDQVFGFVTYDRTHQRFVAGRPANISRTSNVMTMEATGAIVQGTQVKLNVSTVGGVAQSMGVGDYPIGHALDGASASGQLIRVYINAPDFGPQRAVGQGVLDYRFSQNLLTVQLGAGANNVAPGTAMEMLDGTQDHPNVQAADNDADAIFGFVVDAGQGPQSAGAFVLIAQTGSTMYLDATAAFNRGTQVCVDQANAGHVTVLTSGRTVVGWAMDKADANDTGVRIRLNAPSFITAS